MTAEQEERIRRLALQRRRSEAEVIREALDRLLDAHASNETPPLEKDALWAIVGLGVGDSGDVSANVDAYLYGGKE